MAPPLLSTRLRQPYMPTTCVHCAVALEYLPSTPAPEEPFSLQCAACKQTWIIRPPPAKGKSGKRRIGTGASCFFCETSASAADPGA